MGWGMSVFPDDPPAGARPGLRTSVRVLGVILPMAAAVGSATALFLWSLDQATLLRHAHPGLLWLLPLAGLGIGLLYKHAGGGAEGGNNRVIDAIHEPARGVPRRMAPLILLTTVVTHLFGGSAGREGTAVQMGAGIASTFARALRRPPSELRSLLLAGVAAGFGAVFGTPLAGTVFALEVLVRGRLHAPAFAPCLLAALVGDWTCRAWGIVHTPYAITAAPLPLHDLASLGATPGAGRQGGVGGGGLWPGGRRFRPRLPGPARGPGPGSALGPAAPAGGWHRGHPARAPAGHPRLPRPGRVLAGAPAR
jgi:H+/Cl- antiporter ClcA